MQNTGTIDLGFIGNTFTWRNNREGLAHIRPRLDRAIVNDRWKTLFPSAIVTHLTAPNSDHNPIILNLFQEQHKKPYAWTRDPSYKNVVSQAWNINIDGSRAFKFSKKIKQTKLALKEWNKTHF